MLRLATVCLILTVAQAAVVRQKNTQPWTIIERAAAHVSDWKDNTLRFQPQEDPFEAQWHNFKIVHSKNTFLSLLVKLYVFCLLYVLICHFRIHVLISNCAAISVVTQRQVHRSNYNCFFLC